VPWQERLLIGTTDDELASQTRMVVEKEEADYLLRQLNPYLKNPLRLQDALSGMAGLRPLVAAPGQTETSQLIRDHEVELDSFSGLISILGGKWTTHRLMAEDTINTVQREMGNPVTECKTKQHSLAGSENFNEDLANRLEKEYSLAGDVARHLCGKFGSRAVQVLQLLAENPGWKERSAAGLAVIQAEIVYCIRNEMAESIGDLLARRTGAELYGWKQALAAAPVVASLLADEKRWESARASAAVSDYSSRIIGLLDALELNEA